MATWLQTFHVTGQERLFDQCTRYSSGLSLGEGLEWVAREGLYLKQVRAQWSSSANMAWQVMHPSGYLYTLQEQVGATSYILNDSARYTVWLPLPAGSRLRIEKMDESSTGLFEVALTWDVINHEIPWQS